MDDGLIDTKYSVIHNVARCMVCNWEEEDYLKNVSELAEQHARETGHKVEQEIGRTIENIAPIKKQDGTI